MKEELNVIHEQTCKVCRDSIDKQFETDTFRLNAHSETLDDLKEIVIRLTQLQEIQTEAIKIQTRTIENQTKTIEAIEYRVRELEIAKEIESEGVKTFLNSSAGQWVVKGLTVIVVFIVLAALGKTIDQDFIKSLIGG